MKILGLVLLGLALLVGLIALIGAFLPRGHVVTRSVRYDKSALELYTLVRAFDQTPTWRTGLKGVELLPAQDHQPRFREDSVHGSITYRVLVDRPGEKLVTEIADENLPFGGTWTFEFTPSGAGVTMRITERGEVKAALFRFLGRFVFGHHRTIETYLRDLGRKLGETAPTAP